MPIKGEDKEYYFLVPIHDDFSIKTLLEIRKAVEVGVDAGHKVVVFNMSFCTYMDSSGVGLLMNLYKKLTEKEGRLVLLKPKGEIKSLISVTDLETVIGVYNTESEMEKALEDVRVQFRIDKAKAAIDEKHQ